MVDGYIQLNSEFGFFAIIGQKKAFRFMELLFVSDLIGKIERPCHTIAKISKHLYVIRIFISSAKKICSFVHRNKFV